jgi:hypothetical protein
MMENERTKTIADAAIEVLQEQRRPEMIRLTPDATNKQGASGTSDLVLGGLPSRVLAAINPGVAAMITIVHSENLSITL